MATDLNIEREASLIADSLPTCGEDSDLISLCDIVITGIETDWTHFWVHKYDPDANGGSSSWGVLAPLPSAGRRRTTPHVAHEGCDEGETCGNFGYPYEPVELFAPVVRRAVWLYLKSRLEGGLGLDEARQLVDGSYTDAEIADSILQFALYGQEIYG